MHCSSCRVPSVYIFSLEVVTRAVLCLYETYIDGQRNPDLQIILPLTYTPVINHTDVNDHLVDGFISLYLPLAMSRSFN